MQICLPNRSVETRAVLAITLILLVPPVCAHSIHPKQTQTSSFQIDLNVMMLDAWEEWDSLLTRWFSTNGTLVDPYDFARRDHGDPSNVTLSGIGPFLLALMNIYEETGNHYYLSKLQAIVEGLIDNPLSYRIVPGFGEIFYVPMYYFDGVEHDNSPVNTMVAAFASLKLWKWTGILKFGQLAERVAAESLSLAAISNATDLAWSQGYYAARNVDNAKLAIVRQAPASLFYTLCGKEIDPAYLDHVRRALHWQFRAQLDSGGFARHIGEATEHKANTGVHILFLTWGNQISSDPFSDFHMNIAKCISWLQLLPIDFDYLQDYAVTGALINAWKANYTIDTAKIKTATYIGLKVLDFTAYGAFPKVTSTAHGWRSPQLSISCFYASYPLPDGGFEPTQISRLISYSTYVDTDKNIEYGWRTDQGFDRFRVNSPFGSGIYHYSLTEGRTLYFFFNRDQLPSRSTIENGTYYLNLEHEYASTTVEQQIYTTGLVMSRVSGTASFSITQASQDAIDIVLHNGTKLVLNELCNSTLNLGDKFIINHQANTQQLFFVMSQSSIWTAYNQTYWKKGLLQLNTTITNGKLLLARIVVPISIPDVWSLFDIYASYFDQADPLSFPQMVESYVALQDRVGERRFGLPDWKIAYEKATQEEVKLVAHSHPERVSVTEWTLSDSQLMANISGLPEVTSAFKIYSGLKVSPLKVLVDDVEQQLQTDWAFDPETRIATLNLTFSSSLLELSIFSVRDTTPPTILSVEQTVDNPQYNDTVAVRANVLDDESGVRTVLLAYSNGTSWLNTTMNLNLDSMFYEGQIPPLPYATVVSYRVHSEDLSRNWVSSENYAYMVLDTYPPVVRFVTPAHGSYVGTLAQITTSCHEPNLERMDLYLDDLIIETWLTNGTQQYKWNTTDLAEGSSHILKLTAHDLAGNSANVTAEVLTDPTRPSIGSPSWNPQNPSLGQKVTIIVSVVDETSGVDRVDIWYWYEGVRPFRLKTSLTLMEGMWIAEIESPQYEVTVYFVIEAFDKAQNGAHTPLFEYDVIYREPPSLRLGILVVIGAASVSIIIFFISHKGKRDGFN